MTSRRKFILQCSAAATLAAAPAGVGWSSPFHLRDVSLDRLGYSTFARLVGSQFYAYPSLTPIKLELVEARAGRGQPFRQRARALEPEDFSLIFRGAQDQPLGQDSYPFAHEQIGRFVMFIVPVWASDAVRGSRCYEAVFNRPGGTATQPL
jgi:hypothetical protein